MRLACVFLAGSLSLSGCLSGTEVGNPEVSMSVSIIPAQGWEMLSFPVKVLASSYRAGTDSGTLWNRADGYFLDAADSNLNSIPAQAVPSVAWTSASVRLGFPKSTHAPADTTAWTKFRDSGWVSFRYNYEGVQEKLLFALPDSLQVPLNYDANTLNASRHANTLDVTVWFDCRVWVSALGSDSLTYRSGGADGPFAVLSPTENTGTYLRLLNSIPLSFTSTPP